MGRKSPSMDPPVEGSEGPAMTSANNLDCCSVCVYPPNDDGLPFCEYQSRSKHGCPDYIAAHTPCKYCKKLPHINTVWGEPGPAPSYQCNTASCSAQRHATVASTWIVSNG